MKTLSYLTLVLACLSPIYPAAIQAQIHEPYLTSATFYLCVDDWADIWLNGVHIVDQSPYTDSKSGYRTITSLPSSLCYFKNENILAVEVTDTTVEPPGKKDMVGIAYVLKLRFSDGSSRMLSSNDLAQHRSFYISDKMLGNPLGWQRIDFDESDWKTAQSPGGVIEGAASLNGPEFGGEVEFLSARAADPRALYLGERHLFRRKFHLDISENPNCLTPTATPFLRIRSIRTIATPIFRFKSIFTPTPVYLAAITPVLISAKHSPLASVPQPLPKTYYSKRRELPAAARVWLTATPTPTFSFVPVSPNIPLILPSPTFTVRGAKRAVIPASDDVPSQVQTVVFGQDSANIFVTFADGPGEYQLEVVDQRGKHLKILLDRQVVAQTEMWVDWDGKDEGGKDVAPGQYFVLYSKQGKTLQKIPVIRVP